MNDPRPVALKFRPVNVPLLEEMPPARVARFLRKRRERAPLIHLHLLTLLPAHRRQLRSLREFVSLHRPPWVLRLPSASANAFPPAPVPARGEDRAAPATPPSP